MSTKKPYTIEFRLKLARKLAKTWIHNDYWGFSNLVEFALNSNDFTSLEKTYINRRMQASIIRFEKFVTCEVMTCY